MNLTQKAVAALELPPGKDDHIAWDDELPGFGYRLRRRSSAAPVRRSWIAQYRAGGTRRVKLGDGGVLSAEAARAAAKKVLARVTLGHDPQGEKRDRRAKDRHSLRSVIKHIDDEGIAQGYLPMKQAEVRPSTFREIKRYLTGPYFRQLHAMPIDKIERRDVASCLAAIMRANSAITAGRARAALSSFFTWAMTMGLVQNNPVIGAIKPQESAGRSRVLAGHELAAIWNRCTGEFGTIVKLMTLTAARRAEIGGIVWSELNEETGEWTLPAGRSKNGKAHTLPLPQAAWDLIKSVPRRASREHLFGVHANQGFTNWHAKDDLDARLGETVAPWRLHDIRRGVATGMANIGIAPHVIEQILNHVSGHKGGIAGVYNRSSYEREVRAALATWADHVRALVEGGERRVVPFLPVAAS